MTRLVQLGPPRRGLTVTQYWHAKEPPASIADLLETFPLHNPGLRRRVFDHSSASAFISEHCSRREADAFRSCAVPASQADYLRYCAGRALGGLCADADVRFVAPVPPLVERAKGGILFGRRDAFPDSVEEIFGFPHKVGRFHAVVNGLFSFRDPNHPLLELALEVATANIEGRVGNGRLGVWVTTGPGVFTSIYLLRELGSIDAFLDYAVGTALEPSAHLFCEVVGECSRAEHALEGVEMAPIEEVGTWAQHAGVHRESPGLTHWSLADGDLFR